MELTARADELVEKYSTGMKQRVVLARALLARPPIILLLTSRRWAWTRRPRGACAS